MKRMILLSIIIGFMFNTSIWPMNEENADGEVKEEVVEINDENDNGCCPVARGFNSDPELGGGIENCEVGYPFKIRCGKNVYIFAREPFACACCLCISIGGVVFL